MGIERQDKTQRLIEMIPRDLREKAIKEIKTNLSAERFSDTNTPESFLSLAIESAFKQWGRPQTLDGEKITTIAQHLCICGINKDTADQLVQILILSTYFDVSNKKTPIN